MTTGEKIAALRRKAGASQEALAAQLGVSRQAVSRWETNESLPDTEKIIQLSRIFQVPTDDLLLPDKPAENAEAPLPEEAAEPSRLTAAATRWFRLGGAALTCGGAILTLAVALAAFLYSRTLNVWYADFGKFGTALRKEWFSSYLSLGLLLMLIGLLLLAAWHLLRKRP